MKNDITKLKICVVGLGYVGLPLAIAFGKEGVKTYGFDLNKKRVSELRTGFDKNGETTKEEIKNSGIKFSSEEKVLGLSNFIIICVPSPVDEEKRPDFSFLISASKIVGKNLRRKTVVVFESTVYPGATEEVCIPVIEKYSGFKAGSGFFFGYSPERINPGDNVHSIDKVIKVVSGMDKKTMEYVARVYSLICKAGVHKAKSVRVAEAAKVIENTQRDLNIALINELSVIFHKIGISTKDVLDAASTKWNFVRFNPGLVGGHCVGVDPFYLIAKSLSLGYIPKVIGAGRQTNDEMSKFVVQLTNRAFLNAGKEIGRSRILILGLTFKENISDLRNSKVFEIIRQLMDKRAEVVVYDPLVKKENIQNLFFNFETDLRYAGKFDAVIFCVVHKKILEEFSLEKIKKITSNRPILVDVKSVFDEEEAQKKGYIYCSL